MKICILFFTLIGTFSALYSADDRMLTLQSNDGACIILPSSVARHSITLHNIIGDCPTNQTIPTPNFNEQELILLVNVLNTIHQAMSNDDAIAKLCDNIHRETELTLAYLDNFFVIPVLQQAIAKDVAAIFAYAHVKKIREKRLLIHNIHKSLREAYYHDNNLSNKDLIGLQQVAYIVKNAQTSDTNQFLKSEGRIKRPYFIGASLKQLYAHGRLIEKYEDCQNELVGGVSDIHYDAKYVNSLEGLICLLSPSIDVENKKKTFWLQGTSVDHLSANSFQRISSPAALNIGFNKGLTYIHPEAFAGLHTLKKLFISNSVFTRLPIGALNCLMNLQHLVLDRTSFDPLLLHYCFKLKTLTIAQNQLKEIPSWWPRACATLKEITIHNDIRSIPPSFFDYFPQLKSLSLGYNDIQHIHADIFKNAKHLTYLDLEKNPIPQQEIDALRTALPNVKIAF